MVSLGLKVGVIVGVLVGVGLLAGGGLELLSGSGGSEYQGLIPTATGPPLVVFGNLPVVLGIVLIFAGIATIGGVLSVAIRRWDEAPDD